SVEAAKLADAAAKGTGEVDAREQAKHWLATDQPEGGFPRKPLHWPLVFPEVFQRGGFDGIVGNPPFLGGTKITGPLGKAYREHLVQTIANGIRAGGRCDLAAFFALRAHALLTNSGQAGLIATNSLAQGDTREVGLETLINNGVTIRQSIKSDKWPSKSAAIEYCMVCTSCAPLCTHAARKADGLRVSAITSSLTPASEIDSNPFHLTNNANLTHEGCKPLGMGFVMEATQARKLIDIDPKNQNVLSPYINGQDINSRPDCSASRWVINFQDWPEHRARMYRDVFDIIEREVKPERQRRRPDGNFVLRRPLPERYWHYAEKRSAMTKAISGLNRVVVIARVSKTVMPVMVPTGQVISEQVVVFASDDTAMLALLSSAPHYWWAVTRASTLETRVRYTPSDVFETFPLPELTQEMRNLGDRLDTYRRDVMLTRDLGLTKTYNLVFDPACQDADIVELRRIHKAIDEATVRAYGWDDLLDGLDHGFHPAGVYTRYTIGPAAQREILDRLLELNHARYAEEKAKGLHDKRKPKARAKKAASDDEAALF
ncbi:type IIL restriction-modification enzyme MmeI, partial [Amycolatopsis rhizosphaerae]|uniref:type IIL restriction-modification enzyme MmeI n=1 Tax=Amycolatopsis rhizosphaerae TaxID=2053003 RepID=UPI00319E6C0E